MPDPKAKPSQKKKGEPRRRVEWLTSSEKRGVAAMGVSLAAICSNAFGLSENVALFVAGLGTSFVIALPLLFDRRTRITKRIVLFAMNALIICGGILKTTKPSLSAAVPKTAAKAVAHAEAKVQITLPAETSIVSRSCCKAHDDDHNVSEVWSEAVDGLLTETKRLLGNDDVQAKKIAEGALTLPCSRQQAASLNFQLGCLLMNFASRNNWSFELLSEAINRFAKSLSLWPDNPPARAGMAQAYKLLGHFDQAIPNFKIALITSTEEETRDWANLGLGQILVTSEGHVEEGKEYLQKATQSNDSKTSEKAIRLLASL